MPLDILFLDNHLLVVNKAAGVLVQGDETGDATLLDAGKVFLKERFDKPGNVFLGLVHRLDRPASGVMVLARTSKAAARLTDQFKRRTPDKRYLAIVEGTCDEAGLCEDYLVKEDREVRVVEPGYPKAKRAMLQWRLLASQDGLSLVSIQLKTGRPHQIRVQMAHRGWPLLGDFRYGASHELDGRNLALHCYRLTIEHPTLRKPMTWRAAPPPSWNGYFDKDVKQVVAA